MKFSKQEIALAKKLHELGVRKEIHLGDWFFNIFSVHMEICLEEEFSSNNKYNKCQGFIPLWTWKDARKWLREKGWAIYNHHDGYPNRATQRTVPSMITLEIRTYKKGVLLTIQESGEKDEEAILKCMVEVKKGG